MATLNRVHYVELVSLAGKRATMAFQEINANQVLHHGSPFYLNMALHTFGAVYAPVATAINSLGVVRSALKNPLTNIEVNATAALASGETLAVAVKAVTPAGAVSTLGSVTLNATKVSGAGKFTVALGSTLTTPPAVGSVLYLDATYTAGGTPAAPTLSVVVQMG